MAHPLRGDARFVQRALEARRGERISYQWCLGQVQTHLTTAIASAKGRSVKTTLLEIIQQIST